MNLIIKQKVLKNIIIKEDNYFNEQIEKLNDIVDIFDELDIFENGSDGGPITPPPSNINHNQ